MDASFFIKYFIGSLNMSDSPVLLQVQSMASDLDDEVEEETKLDKNELDGEEQDTELTPKRYLL